MNIYIAQLFRGVGSQPQVIRTFEHQAESLDDFVKNHLKPHNGYSQCKVVGNKVYLFSINFGEYRIIDFWEIVEKVNGIRIEKSDASHRAQLLLAGLGKRKMKRKQTDQKPLIDYTGQYQRSFLVKRKKSPVF